MGKLIVQVQAQAIGMNQRLGVAGECHLVQIMLLLTGRTMSITLLLPLQ